MFCFPSFQTTTYSLLFYAHHFSNNYVFKLLLERGANCLWRNNRKANILQLLAKVGNQECAKMCLNKLKETEPERIPDFVENRNLRGNDLNFTANP